MPSTMRSGEAIAAVWAIAACLPDSVAPLFSSTTGFLRVTSRATSRKRCGRLKLSM